MLGDSMILQRNQPLHIWGWASPGEKVKITFNKKQISTSANKLGEWSVSFPAMQAGGPYNMKLEATNTLNLTGILIGDVWLCSGQSNMVHQMKLHAVRYEEDIEAAHYPEIRQFWVPTATHLSGPELKLAKGAWKSANPENVRDFSAVAYFFARNVYDHHRVPIGIINSSVGGTPIEAWTSEEGLRAFEDLQKLIKRNKDTAYVNTRNRTVLSPSRFVTPDKGLSEAVKWFDTDYAPKGWRRINIPGYWEDQGLSNLDGVVWYRQEFELDAELTGDSATLFMGRIVDADEVYINGRQVGRTTYQYPQRIYPIPSGLLRKGKNLIVVRVENHFGKGGFVPDKPYYLKIGKKKKLDLKGDWDYKVGRVKLPVSASRDDGPIAAQNQPSALYNAMIAPFRNYSTRGVLWYQGESNSGNAARYKDFLPALIKVWRKQFRQPDLPFYYVQLPGFADFSYLPVESSWPLLREAALQTLELPQTGMAVTIDLGEWNDVHPDRKKEVGDRLALIARHFDYGEKNLIYSGPLFRSSEIHGSKIRLNFSHVGTGLVSIDGEELSDFAIAGADKKFVWAHARIIGDQVEVWSDEIAAPMYVRYAWADNPVNPNLYNKENLPASPFRTDF